MSGESESSVHLTVDQELARMNDILDKYEIQCGLPPTVNENTKNIATELLNTDFSNFRKTAEECGEAASALSQYALNLKRVINKERAIVHWCENRIMKIVGEKLRQYNTYNSFNERLNWAINEDSVAGRLRYIKIEAELRLLRIEDLFFNVKSIADKFSDLQKGLRGIR